MISINPRTFVHVSTIVTSSLPVFSCQEAMRALLSLLHHWTENWSCINSVQLSLVSLSYWYWQMTPRFSLPEKQRFIILPFAQPVFLHASVCCLGSVILQRFRSICSFSRLDLRTLIPGPLQGSSESSHKFSLPSAAFRCGRQPKGVCDTSQEKSFHTLFFLIVQTDRLYYDTITHVFDWLDHIPHGPHVSLPLTTWSLKNHPISSYHILYVRNQ